MLAVAALALTGSTSWEYGEPKSDAGLSITLGIGGVLSNQPPMLYPETQPNNTGSGSPSGLGLNPDRQGGETGYSGRQPAASSNLASTPPADPPYPIFLPTWVDHDGAVVSAASVRVQALGGVLSNAPPSLYPECTEARCGGMVDAPGLWTLHVPGAERRVGSMPSTGSQEPASLNLWFPTHVDHDGAVVSAASVRVQALGGSLSESEMIAVLRAAGWPTGLHSQALAVAWCESKWSPYALGDSGRSAGLFQLNIATWFRYAGEDSERWADPLVNARVAWATYQYDIGRGYEPWRQWSCKP